MRHPWTEFVRVGSLVTGGFVVLHLAVHLVDAGTRGWSLGSLPELLVILASGVDGIAWYFPVGALAGGIAAAVTSELRRGPRPMEVLIAGAGLALVTFVMAGFIGPRVFHLAGRGVLPEGMATVANDWTFFLSRAAEAEGDELMPYAAMVHGTVALAVLTSLMLPLGLAIGRGSRRFAGRGRRRAVWAMAATTTLVVYGAQAVSWRLAVIGEVSPAPLLYAGYWLVPLVLLFTLAWAGATSSGSWPGSSPSSDPTPSADATPSPDATA